MVERFKGDGAQDYDQRISRLVPGYALLHQLSAAQLMTRLGPRARVLLVGVGTGSELLLLGQSCPEWQFIAQDISADMLAQARQRAELADMAERVTWWEGPLPVQSLGCDGALCLLVLHFLPLEQKTALVRDIARQLRAGSPLLMADLMAAQDDTERAVMGLQAHLAGLPLSASEQMVQRLDRDFFPLNEDQTRQLLGAAGFGTGWRYFQALGFHGWLAERD
ncbi:class I SAM-dependent methyltransferase [Aeromonas salmonicida]|uniref:class I SAM-dependent methyltransferase n=1 Tax=Aeromonas salmonicida TaxID=645 RepID=UPI001864BC30|nr:class I SAM-dependent methyltransferase [Aeromonas salmonicida]